MIDTPEKDWFEDFSHENGKYSCLCSECGEEFIGHKRRVICRECFFSFKDREENFKLGNGDIVTDGDIIRPIDDEESRYKVYHNGVDFWFRTISSNFPADYNLKEYKDRVRKVK